jgi:hypothetical protein
MRANAESRREKQYDQTDRAKRMHSMCRYEPPPTNA